MRIIKRESNSREQSSDKDSTKLGYESVQEHIKRKVMEQIDASNYINDTDFKQIVKDVVVKEIDNEYVAGYEKNILIQDIFNEMRKLGPIQELLDNDKDGISEIMINGHNAIFYEKNGCMYKFDKKFESENKLKDIIQKMVSTVNRTVNESNPIVDARLSDGSRINVVLPPVSLDGPIVTIRKFIKDKISLEGLIERGSLTIEAAEFLKKLVISKYNIFISGGTGSGKTTFLNALCNYIPPDERLITIEDSAEIHITNIPNLVRLEVRNANVEGNNEISIRNLIKASLRMRPDRIIVGEIRDEAAIDLLNAYNTGHDGSISTGHANSAMDMISRLESMVLMGIDIPIEVIRKNIASSIDIIIHLGRLRDKSRRVMEISEVVGYENGQVVLNKLYEFKEFASEVTEQDRNTVSGNLCRTESNLKNCEKLYRAGFISE